MAPRALFSSTASSAIRSCLARPTVCRLTSHTTLKYRTLRPTAFQSYATTSNSLVSRDHTSSPAQWTHAQEPTALATGFKSIPPDDDESPTATRNRRLRGFYKARDEETEQAVEKMLASPFVPNRRQYPNPLSTKLSDREARRIARVHVAQQKIWDHHGRKTPTLNNILKTMAQMADRKVAGPRVEAMRVLLPEQLDLDLPKRRLDYVESATGIVAKLNVSADHRNPKRGIILRGKGALLAKAADELIAFNSDIEIFRLGDVSVFDYEMEQLWPSMPPESDASKGEGQAPVESIWVHREVNIETRETRYEDEPLPSEWTKYTFHEYISSLIEKRLSPANINTLYPYKTDTDGIRINLIMNTFEDPSLRQHITPPILNYALSFISHRGGHRAAAERLFRSAQEWGVPLDTTTFNIMLGSYVKNRSTAHFLRVLRRMKDEFYAPNMRTWLHVLKLVEKDDDRRRVMVNMYEHGALQDPTARREIAKIMAPHDLHIALKQGQTLQDFSRAQANRYGDDWFTSAALARIVDEFLMFYGPDDARFQELGVLFSRPPDDGKLGYLQPLVAMMQAAQRRHDWEIALWALKLMDKLGLQANEEVYDLLVSLSLRTKAPHALGALLIHGIACEKLTWQAEKKIQQALLGAQPFWWHVGVKCFNQGMMEEMRGREWQAQRYPILEVRGAVRNVIKGLNASETVGALVRRVYQESDIPWKEERERGRELRLLDRARAPLPEGEVASNNAVTTTAQNPGLRELPAERGSEEALVSRRPRDEMRAEGEGDPDLRPLTMHLRDSKGSKKTLTFDSWVRRKNSQSLQRRGSPRRRSFDDRASAEQDV
ncbi:pentatricopeptide repeat domain-containing protein [Sarocladium implicatum]|nr:pentatricopeptide repeat domain-containing protein [Sarocladium implicatum]